jgi:uncharacterized damage-inducible protein DinB
MLEKERTTMEDKLQDSIALLERTPAALNALLRELPVSMICSGEGEGTWSISDVLGHLVDCEHVNWMPRARMIRAQASQEAFPPFARDGHLREGSGKSLEELLDAFAAIRAENLRELRDWKLQPADLELQGLHPAFGAVTLSQLLATWAAHDLTHLHQISRILAYPYRQAVGPWVKYLGVLHCNGHGA